MRFILSISIVVCLWTGSNAQDILGKYESAVPHGFRFPDSVRAQVSSMLIAKQTIHPHLVYFYLAYYRRSVGDSTVFENVSSIDLPRRISAIGNSYIARRVNWIQHLIEVLPSYDTDIELARNLRELASNYKRSLGSTIMDAALSLDVDSAQYYYLIAQ